MVVATADEIATTVKRREARRVFLVNPASAGGRAAESWPDVEERLQAAGESVVSYRSTQPGDLENLADRATEAGVTEIVAVGGDGTVHEVVNGIVRAASRLGLTDAGARPALGIIPSGRGDDLARALGISSDPIESCRLLTESVGQDQQNSKLLEIDLGWIEYQSDASAATSRRAFLNIAGCGFDGAITQRANGLAGTLGPLSYPVALFMTLVSFQPRTYRLTVDGETLSGTARSIVVANGQYFGGGMHIAPHADVQDGQFDIVVLGDLSRWQVMTSSSRIYQGSHLSHPDVNSLRGANVRVETEPPDAWIVQADGEILGRTPLEYELEPAALKLRVPSSGESSATPR